MKRELRLSKQQLLALLTEWSYGGDPDNFIDAPTAKLRLENGSARRFTIVVTWEDGT